jgi:hypothetical protein
MTLLALIFGPVVLPVLIALVALLWIIFARHIWRPIVLAVAMATGVVIVQTVAHLVQRPRPPVNLMLLAKDHTFSFPSGHVMATSDFLMISAYLLISRKPTRRKIIAASIVIPLVIFSQIVSRMYLGYHWLSDTLASVSLAIMVTSFVILIDTIYTTRTKKPHQTPSQVIADVRDHVGAALAEPVVKVAETANQNRKVEFVARFGYIANGLFHGLLGLAVITVCFGSSGELDQSGVLEPFSKLLLGKVFLSLLFLGFLALGVWKIVQLVMIGTSKVTRHWTRKVEETFKAIVYIVLGVSIGVYVFSPLPSTDSASESIKLISSILSHPFGAVGVGLLGIGLLGVGINFIVRGITRSFLRSIDEPDEKVRLPIVVAGSVGYITKGLVFVAFGVVLFSALFSGDPSKARGLDGAFRLFGSLPFGTYLLFIIGLGFIMYAIYSIARAKLAHIKFRKHKYI